MEQSESRFFFFFFSSRISIFFFFFFFLFITHRDPYGEQHGKGGVVLQCFIPKKKPNSEEKKLVQGEQQHDLNWTLRLVEPVNGLAK